MIRRAARFASDPSVCVLIVGIADRLCEAVDREPADRIDRLLYDTRRALKDLRTILAAADRGDAQCLDWCATHAAPIHRAVIQSPAATDWTQGTKIALHYVLKRIWHDRRSAGIFDPGGPPTSSEIIAVMRLAAQGQIFGIGPKTCHAMHRWLLCAFPDAAEQIAAIEFGASMVRARKRLLPPVHP